jgi:hypothetical protein
MACRSGTGSKNTQEVIFDCKRDLMFDWKVILMKKNKLSEVIANLHSPTNMFSTQCISSYCTSPSSLERSIDDYSWSFAAAGAGR